MGWGKRTIYKESRIKRNYSGNEDMIEVCKILKDIQMTKSEEKLSVGQIRFDSHTH